MYQDAVNIVRYLLDMVKMVRLLIDTNRGYHLGASNIHIPLPDLPIR
jgi:hypothetical protein